MIYSPLLPTDQNMLDMFVGSWTSKMPAGSGLKTVPGAIPLFDDDRMLWPAEVFGGFKGKTILELGPLEGGHSYMMQQMGARRVRAIEANSQAFLKCLCIKEIFELDRVKFMYGDFRQYLEVAADWYDLVFASGVLYHMTEPVKLIKQISNVTDKVYIWTHYYAEREIPSTVPERFGPLETMEYDGATYQGVRQNYNTAPNGSRFCGGTATTSCWLTKESIILALKKYGFTRLDFNFENTTHPYGPCISICARKET